MTTVSEVLNPDWNEVYGTNCPLIQNEVEKQGVLAKFKAAPVSKVVSCVGRNGPWKYIQEGFSAEWCIADNNDGIRRYYRPAQWGGGILVHEERFK